MATFSDEEGKGLIKIFAEMGVKPKASNPEELQSWMLQHLKSSGKIPDTASLVKQEPDKSSPSNPTPSVHVTVPEKLNISVFSGGVKDTSYDHWRCKVDYIMKDGNYSEQQILKSVRKSLRGEAARMSMRLGIEARVPQILDKLEDAFGLASRKRHIMKNFYCAYQSQGEDVLTWSSRLDELLDQAKKLGKVEPKDANEMLCEQFWSGLRPELRAGTEHKFDSITDFDKLRL